MATGLSASPSVVTTQEDALAVMEELTTHIKVGAGGHGYWLLNVAWCGHSYCKISDYKHKILPWTLSQLAI